MNLLIIGASGFIGSHIFHRAQQEGINVIGTRFSSSKQNLITFDVSKDSIGNVLPDTFLSLETPTYAVICSAITQIDLCAKDKENSYNFNVRHIIRLVEELTKKGIQIVYLSSEAVYDGAVGYYSEKDLPTPINEYGRQKVEVEKFLLKHHPNSLVFRLSMIVGDNPSEPHLFSDWSQLIQRRKPIVCIKGQIFSPTFVDDVACGILLGLKNNLSGLYHLSNKEFFAREKLARQFVYQFDRLIEKTGTEVVSIAECEFGFLDRRQLKTYLDGALFEKATNMHFTSMREVMEGFLGKLSPKGFINDRTEL